MYILYILSAYLIGSLSAAILVAKFFNLSDPRTQGSNNPGATNMLRVAGKLPAALTLLFDLLKGSLVIIIGKYLCQDNNFLAALMLAVFLGHLYPIFFKFKGGKGVATAIGAIIAISWPLGLSLVAIWILSLVVFRISAVAALISSIAAPILGYLWLDSEFFLPLVSLVIMLIYKHKSNIAKLMRKS